MLRSAVLYIALACGANAALADTAAIEALREGTLKKLTFAEPRPVPEAALTDIDGAPASLADYRGKWVLVNFWATWCAPCRKEMPGLDALQIEFGGEDFAVVPVATGRNPPPAIRRFFEETGVTSLKVLLDPQQRLARDMGILGLPVTVVLNPEGEEVARLLGDADWGSDSARAIVKALIAQE